MEKLIYPELSYKINGILFAVHNELGQFCNEKQYADSIENYLKKNNLSYEREKILPPSFENELKGRNRTDFLIEDKIVLELKAKNFISKEDYYQAKRYLTALNKKLGILVNFRRKFMIKKNTKVIFENGDNNRSEEMVGGMPLTKGEVLTVHNKSGKKVIYEVADKIIDAFLDREDQVVNITYILRKK